jgi:hypothetical protein
VAERQARFGELEALIQQADAKAQSTEAAWQKIAQAQQQLVAAA